MALAPIQNAVPMSFFETTACVAQVSDRSPSAVHAGLGNGAGEAVSRVHLNASF